MSFINDPARVQEQYADEANLEARRALYANATGPDPREVVFEAIRAAAPARVLEVGGGPGELAARVQEELDAEVVMLDVAPRMVELAQARGVDATVGDVQDLPFADGCFDLAIAAWMLFHVPDVDRALSELARVLRPGGRLVAVTNAAHHLEELRRIAGSRAWSTLTFDRESGEALVRRHFRGVERIDVDGEVVVEDDETVRAWVASLGPDVPEVLPSYELPIRTRRATSIFVAEKPA